MLQKALLAAALAGLYLTQAQASVIVPAGSGPLSGELHVQSAMDGSNQNLALGAQTFYNAGYTGSSATAANIEAGYAWDGHQTLSHVTQLPQGSSSGGLYDAHATGVTSLIGGRANVGGVPTERQQGIAYNATLWSGAIAQTINPGGQFIIASREDLLTPYRAAALGTGMPGNATADVVNSSWGDKTAHAGADFTAVALDALANASNKTFVFSAGNSGPGANTVGSPGSGYNSITVGALGGNAVSGYNTLASFSSRGPVDTDIPLIGDSFNRINASRAAVDITAPGTQLYGALFAGTAGADNQFNSNLNGTSFAAPIVAGGATLVVDAARSRGYSEGTDGRVVKSILMNSADHLTTPSGSTLFSHHSNGTTWNNGQTLGGDGVIRTTQALDYGLGAGLMNLDTAYQQLTGGTTGVAGMGSGNLGNVDVIGWDLGEVSEGTDNEYYLAQALLGGTKLTVTLNWFVDSLLSATNQIIHQSLDDLSLEVHKVDAAGTTLVAQSDSAYDNVEHLFFDIAETAMYMIKVLWDGEVWDLVGDANSEVYGLSWFGTGTDLAPTDPTVPVAPAWILLLSGMLLLRRHFRRI